MDRTDTHEQLETLQGTIERDRRRRRLVWGAGSLAVAAAVVGAVVLVNTLTNDSPDTGTPAKSTDATPVDVATDFLDAYAAYDLDRAVSFLADGAKVTVWSSPKELDGMLRETRWSQAAGFQILPGPCTQQGAPAGDDTVVCTFDYHAFGSDELNRGPFSDNDFTFKVRDEKLVAATMAIAYESNGFSAQMWEPFATWVAANHRNDAAVMYADWPSQAMGATTNRAVALWAEHVPEYVAAVQAGTAN